VSFPVRGFLRTAVVWLAVGLVLGLAMGVEPRWIPLLRAAHFHALLAGFVSFMIFGVGYHVLPRFAGRPVPWSRGPTVHLVLANAGLLGIVGGLLARGPVPAWSPALVGMGGTLVLAGAALFIHAVWHLTEKPRWT
jgi:hypothetical protein